MQKDKYSGSKNKIAVILFGAGAAKEWGGPLSSEIDSIIKNDTKYKIDDKPFGQYIFDELKDFYNYSNINFETFFAVVELCWDYIYSETNDGYTSVADTPFISKFCSMDIMDKIPKENKRGTIFDLYSYYHNLIGHNIEKYFHKIGGEDNSSLNTLFKEYIKDLKEAGYIVRGYTTNYDNLFQDVLDEKYKIFDGFDLSPYSTFEYHYNVDRILNDKKCFSYYNLHGSLYWKIEPNYIDGYKFVKWAYPTIEKSPNNAIAVNSNQIIFPTNIITGYNKTQRISLEPFNLFYNSFLGDCHNSDLVITAGYSFGDPHINSALKLALDNKETKHTHISYSKLENIDEKMQEFKKTIEYHAIQKNSIPEYESLNGILERGKNRKIYLKGFKDFLETRNSELF